MEERGGSLSDEDLLRELQKGDRSAFVELYDRYADGVHDFCFSVLRDRDEAADALHDTFVTASRVVARLRPPMRAQSWLYALARQECIERATVKTSSPPSTSPSEPPPPTGGVWEAIGSLPTDQRLVLDLHLRQRLTGEEVGDAIGLPAEEAASLITSLRNDVERWLAQRKDQTGDGRSALAQLAAVPPVPAPIDMRTQVLVDASLAAEQRPPRGYRVGYPPRLYAPARRRLLAGVASAVLLVGLVTALAWAVAAGDGDDDGDDEAATGVTVLGTQRTTTTTDAPTTTRRSTTTATSTTVTTTTTTTTVPTTTTVTAAPAPRLELATRSLNFGDDAVTGTIRIVNQGERPLSWQAAANAGWLAARPASGTLAPGRSGAFSVVVDRGPLREGQFSASMVVRGGGRRGSVAVRGTVERPPRLLNGRADHTVIAIRGCEPPNQSIVSVTVTDESGISSVRLVGSAGSRAMQPRGGGRYVGVFGPYDRPGSLTYLMEATDVRGNVARSTTGSLRVVDC